MLKFFDTLARREREFVPMREGEVRIYTCGPTVHDYSHIGNFRAFVWEDLLCRTLRQRGFRVQQVMNITDVDDKTIQRSIREKTTLEEVTSRFIDAFFEDLDTLGVERADTYPRATEHIPEMVALIQRLQERGLTYESQGSIYFRLADFPGYGKLTRIHPDAMRSAGRGDADTYEKEDIRDFALWKASRDGEPSWETAIGTGRPGWHLECSAMSMKYLGETFDIHTGGIDNIFPHHDNEIAQSEAATGADFVRYWLHCAHLLVEGEKMSKSLGNFYTLRDLVERGESPMAIRYLLLSQHYRKPLNFTFDGLRWAAGNLERLTDFRRRVAEADAADGSDAEGAARVRTIGSDFTAALDDDLNSSLALAAVFEMVREGNSVCDAGRLRADERAAILAFLDRFDAVFGVLGGGGDEATLETDLQALIDQRQQARQSKDFARADEIRAELEKRGIVMEDTPRGVRWKRKR